MDKIRRVGRIAALARWLAAVPQELHPLAELANRFSMARTTLSEDVQAIREAFATFGLGRVESVIGAAGGVRYIPWWNGADAQNFLEGVRSRLEDPTRIMPGGFLYMTDLLYDAQDVQSLGELLMMRLAHTRPDCIVTVETKGIPLALMVARAFRVPLAVARHDNHVTEGSSVSVSYVTGPTRRIRTMSMAKRALTPGSRVLLIDDFMKEGGTLRGLEELVRDMGAEPVGIGVLVATKNPHPKLISSYEALLHLESVDDVRGVSHFAPVTWEQPDYVREVKGCRN